MASTTRYVSWAVCWQTVPLDVLGDVFPPPGAAGVTTAGHSIHRQLLAARGAGRWVVGQATRCQG
jgi:hypothetical protein